MEEKICEIQQQAEEIFNLIDKNDSYPFSEELLNKHDESFSEEVITLSITLSNTTNSIINNFRYAELE